MRRLFYPGELTPEIRITGGDAHHLARVMRAQLGAVHVVAGTDGRAARMTVTAVARDAVTLRLDSYVEDDAPARAEVILVQALLKGEKTDFVVQKAVELGAAALHPIVTEHVVVRYDAKKAAAKTARWQKIADEAAKQCGRLLLMHVAPVGSIDSILGDAEIFGGVDTTVIFCYEGERMQSMGAVLRTVTSARVVLIVGAEGGFSPAEAARLTAAGAQPVSLGHLILRAETAAIAALTVVQYELGNLDV